jgi:hypothetical protein
MSVFRGIVLQNLAAFSAEADLSIGELEALSTESVH